MQIGIAARRARTSPRPSSWRAFSVFVVALTTAVAVSAAPQPVQLNIQDGRVWLVAHDATVTQILAEWARVGQTTIMNADSVSSVRLTLELPGVPEREALDLLLRSVSGFVATTREENAAAGPADRRSQFQRIVIVARSNAPAGPPVAAAPYPLREEGQGAPPPAMPAPQPSMRAAPGIAAAVQRLVGADGQPVPDDQEDAPERAPQPRPTTMPPGFAAPPQTAPAPDPSATPATTGRVPQGVPVPGMIVAPPTQPGQPQRPPR